MDWLYPSDSLNSLGVFPQTPLDVILYGVDYGNWLVPGDIIATVAIIFDLNTAPALVLSTPTRVTGTTGANTAFTFTVSGGVICTKYTLSFTIVTTGGQTKTDIAQIIIDNPNTQAQWDAYAVNRAVSGNGWPISNPGAGLVGATTGTMQFFTNQINVLTTVTLLAAPRLGPPGTGRKEITIFNFSNQATNNRVYVGPPGVTTSTGLPLLQYASLTISSMAAVYAISPASTVPCGILESY